MSQPITFILPIIVGLFIPAILVTWYVLQRGFEAVIPLSIDVALVAFLTQIGLTVLFLSSKAAVRLNAADRSADRAVYVNIGGALIAVFVVLIPALAI